MLTEILLVLIYIAVLSVLIYRLRIFSLAGISKRWIIAAFVIKIIAGCALGFIYSHHYTDRMKADTFKFFDDSGVMLDALAVNPRHFFELLTGIGQDDPELEPYFYKMNTWMTEDFYVTSNRTMVRLNLLFRFLTPPGEHYYLHVVLFNLLSLLGLIFLCRTFFLRAGKYRKLFFAAVILFPSILFWGSGLLKDGLIIFALGSMVYSFSRMLNNAQYKWLNGFVFVVSTGLLAVIKIYIFFAMIPALGAWIWCGVNPVSVKMKFAFTHLVFILFAVLLHFMSVKYDPVRYLTQKQEQFFHIISVEKPNHVMAIPPVNNSLKNILIYSVPAFFRTMLRPHIFESREPLILISAAENLFLLLLLILILMTSRNGAWSSNPLFYFSLSFFFHILTLIGLIVPITGAIVRYKIAALLFLIYILFSLLENSRLEKYLKRFNL